MRLDQSGQLSGLASAHEASISLADRASRRRWVGRRCIRRNRVAFCPARIWTTSGAERDTRHLAPGSSDSRPVTRTHPDRLRCQVHFACTARATPDRRLCVRPRCLRERTEPCPRMRGRLRRPHRPWPSRREAPIRGETEQHRRIGHLVCRPVPSDDHADAAGTVHAVVWLALRPVVHPQGDRGAYQMDGSS